MPDVIDCAKYFIKQGLDENRNTYDGNMKLQKLLLFADLISLAEYGKPLFDDDLLAYREGCVVENVRLRYKNDYAGLVADSKAYCPDFSQEEYNVLNLTIELFGKLPARELSDINHSFQFWSDAFRNSIEPGGFKDKNKAVVTQEAMLKELDRVRGIIDAFRKVQKEYQSKEVINGIEFYYTPSEFDITGDILEELYTFSLVADEPSYSVCRDGESMVIY